MSKQVCDYFWSKIKENYHIQNFRSQSEKVFSYTWLLSNSLDQSGHQQHHTTRPIEFLLDTGFCLTSNTALLHYHKQKSPPTEIIELSKAVCVLDYLGI
jgi:hypothetical protein